MQKNIQISYDLFHDLLLYFGFGKEELRDKIYKEVQLKLDAMIRRDLYSRYKTAPTEEEQEEARKKYLDMVGMHRDFRW